MTNINKHINSLEATKSTEFLDFLHDNLDKVGIKLTFWGGRKVTVDGYEGSIDWKVLRIKASSFNERKIDLDSQSKGLRVTGTLDGLKELSDEQVKHASFFTRFFVWLREFSFNLGSAVTLEYWNPFFAIIEFDKKCTNEQKELKQQSDKLHQIYDDALNNIKTKRAGKF
ncbi:MAG: hypothetical protein AAGG81_03390 [Chlamydiota bacterium]